MALGVTERNENGFDSFLKTFIAPKVPQKEKNDQCRWSVNNHPPQKLKSLEATLAEKWMTKVTVFCDLTLECWGICRGHGGSHVRHVCYVLPPWGNPVSWPKFIRLYHLPACTACLFSLLRHQVAPTACKKWTACQFVTDDSDSNTEPLAGPKRDPQWWWE